MAGEATEVGSIIGYLRLDRGDWSRGVRDTEADAAKIGRLNPSIRIQTNAGEVVGQLALVQAAEKRVGDQSVQAGKQTRTGLIAALAAVAPAAVPIAAVAGGALIGLLPSIAAVTLGIKGIEKDMKSGALAGTQYGADLKTLGNEYTRLQSIAAGGLLSGIDRGLAQSTGLFATVNKDVGVMAGQLGDVVAGAAPALLRILTQLDPLFVTIGTDLQHGAAALENWSRHSDGVTKFVAYVQAELPVVLDLLGRVVVLFAHLATAAAPFGGVLLHDISALVGALDRIPVGVLEKAIPAAVALYVALKAYAGISAIVNSVNNAVASMTRPFRNAALAAKASSLEAQSAVAQETATTIRAKADEAAAFGTASAEEIASLRAVATEAEAQAAVIAGAAQEAAAASRTAGEEASVGLSATLGPVGAVVAGLAILTTAFLGNSSAEHGAAQAANSYADSLKKTVDLLAKVNVQQTVANLSSKNAFTQLDALDKLVPGLNLSYGDLVRAVNGSQASFDAVTGKLKDAGNAMPPGTIRSHAQAVAFAAQADKGRDLAGVLGTLRSGLHDQQQRQIATNQATKDAAGLTNANAAATTRAASAVAALNTALATFTQNELARAQSEDQFKEAVNGVTQQLKGNHDQLDKTSAKGLANRDAFLAAAQAALSLRDAQIKAGKSTLDADSTLAQNIGQLKHAALAAGANKGQVDKLLRSLGLLPKDIRMKMGIDDEASAKLRVIQQHIDNLHGKQVVISTLYAAPTGFRTGQGKGGVTLQGNASGGAIDGPGPKGVDSVVRVLAPGEWVINDRAVDAINASYGPGAMAMVNRGVLPRVPAGTAAGTVAAPARAGNPRPAAASGPSAADLRAALHGVRFQLDAPGVGTLTGHIASVSGGVARGEIADEFAYRDRMAATR